MGSVKTRTVGGLFERATRIVAEKHWGGAGPSKSLDVPLLRAHLRVDLTSGNEPNEVAVSLLEGRHEKLGLSKPDGTS